MSFRIKESDWKIFSELHSVALERFCEGVLSEVGELIAKPETTAHDRYLILYRMIRERDQELESAFDEFSRSTALLQLAIFRRHRLLTDEEFARFSSETRDHVNNVLRI